MKTFVLLLAMLLPAVAINQDAEPQPPPITGKVLVTWTPVTQDILGNAITVTGYEIGITAPKSDLSLYPGQILDTVKVGPDGYTRADVTRLFLGLRVDNWVIYVRALKGTLVSAWSDPVIVRLPFPIIPPGRPVGVKVTVSLEIEAQ